MKRKRTRKAIIDHAGEAWPAELLKLFPRYRAGPLERKLLKALNTASGERPVHAFLKKHDYLVGMAFRTNSSPRGVVPEFELGAEFRCDFLVLSCCSGWWTADFVELEPPNTRLYLKDGTPSKRLRLAQRQIRTWKQWTRDHEPYLRSRLSNLFRLLNLAPHGGLGMPDAATEIQHPNCELQCSFHIVIGQRTTLSSAEQQARVQESLDTGVSIATYGRLIEAARRFDQADKFNKERFRHWKG